MRQPITTAFAVCLFLLSLHSSSSFGAFLRPIAQKHQNIVDCRQALDGTVPVLMGHSETVKVVATERVNYRAYLERANAEKTKLWETYALDVAGPIPANGALGKKWQDFWVWFQHRRDIREEKSRDEKQHEFPTLFLIDEKRVKDAKGVYSTLPSTATTIYDYIRPGLLDLPSTAPVLETLTKEEKDKKAKEAGDRVAEIKRLFKANKRVLEWHLVEERLLNEAQLERLELFKKQHPDVLAGDAPFVMDDFIESLDGAVKVGARWFSGPHQLEVSIQYRKDVLAALKKKKHWKQVGRLHLPKKILPFMKEQAFRWQQLEILRMRLNYFRKDGLAPEYVESISELENMLNDPQLRPIDLYWQKMRWRCLHGQLLKNVKLVKDTVDKIEQTELGVVGPVKNITAPYKNKAMVAVLTLAFTGTGFGFGVFPDVYYAIKSIGSDFNERTVRGIADLVDQKAFERALLQYLEDKKLLAPEKEGVRNVVIAFALQCRAENQRVLDAKLGQLHAGERIAHQVDAARAQTHAAFASSLREYSRRYHSSSAVSRWIDEFETAANDEDPSHFGERSAYQIRLAEAQLPDWHEDLMKIILYRDQIRAQVREGIPEEIAAGIILRGRVAGN